MRSFEINDNVIISSQLWNVSERNQALNGIIVDKVRNGIFFNYTVKYTLENKERFENMSPYDIYSNKTNTDRLNRKTRKGSVMRKFNIGDNVIVRHTNSNTNQYVKGIIIDTVYFWLFKKYVVKYKFGSSERIDVYSATQVYIDQTKLVNE